MGLPPQTTKKEFIMTMGKKIAASVIAAATMAITSVSAFAWDGKKEEWSINYIFGGPSSVSTQYVDRTLYYYAGGYQTTCDGFDGGGDGHIGVYINGTERWQITGKGKQPSNGPYFVNNSDVSNGMVTFRIKAVGTRVSGNGSIHQY